jgi:hypothetical protein
MEICNDFNVNDLLMGDSQYNLCIRLWRAILRQAMEDALTCSRKKEKISHSKKSIAWFLFDNEDFNEVCSNAFLNPKYVREKAKIYIKKHINGVR